MDFVLPLLFSIFGFCTPSLYSNRKFHFIDEKMSWANAQRYCREKYTDLATIESKADISKFDRANVSFAWMGLHDDPVSWRNTMGKDKNSWRWSSNGETSETGYHNWDNTQPDNLYARELCVDSRGGGKWHDRSCDATCYFVCYVAQGPQSNKTYILIQSGMSWKDAQTYCRTNYKDLAMIENAQENTEMSAVKGPYTVWIGLYRNPWTWSDNSDSSFRNWKHNEPNNNHFQACGLTNEKHLWLDGWCTHEYPFWCQEVPLQKMILQTQIHTDADLSDPAVSAQLLQQIGAVLSEKAGPANLNLKWRIQPRKQEERKPNAGDQCPAK